jgi:hypothetical protein
MTDEPHDMSAEELALALEEIGASAECPELHDPWGFIRTLATGWPLDTAPDHIWRAHAEAMRTLAEIMTALHAMRMREHATATEETTDHDA